jgi:integrase
MQAVRHDLNVIGHLLRTAIREWAIPLPSNPMDNVVKPAMPRARTRRLAKGELVALQDAADEAGLQPAVPLLRFAVETGMRRAELLSVTWSQVDFGKRTLHIPETKNGHPRTIPSSKEATAILRDIYQDGRDRAFPFTAAWVRFAWDKLTRLAGIADLHFHDLRHEAISRFFERGLSVPEVALISGHRDVRQLFRYTHLRAEDVAKKLA